jgi:hypothetical protein
MAPRLSHRRYRAWAWGAAALVVLMLALAAAATRIQYIPSEAVGLSKVFVELIRVGELQKAHDLTVKDGGVGRDLTEFIDKVRRQWPGRDGDARPGVAQVRGVWPFQSYGNRLRRLISGAPAGHGETRVDFSVDGVPFEVRVIHRGDQGWRVRYFQSHAG